MPEQTRYRTIVADPPWHYDGFAQGNEPHRQDRERGLTGMGVTVVPSPYPSMSLAAIQALPIPNLAAPSCRLFLWTTNRYLPDALTLISLWGFSYRQLLVWDKTGHFNPLGGSVAPNSAEFVAVSVRGTPPRLGKWPTSIIRAGKPQTKHSVKPEVFLDLFEQVSPGPYLEMFARRNRLGWDTWGDEALEHIAMGVPA